MSAVITKPKVDISPDLLRQIETQIHEAGQVVLHFLIKNTSTQESGIRIWPTSYLYDLGSDHVSELMHVENITMYPTWQWISGLSKTYFTLIFSGLPKTCDAFSFKELCANQAGAWCVDKIVRNNTDVYFLEIS